MADSFFASVESAQVLFRLALRFIGVVKTASKRYPMAALGKVQMQGRGMWKGLIHRGNKDQGEPDMLAFTWNDTNRRFFIATASSLMATTPVDRPRKRQIDHTEDAEPQDDYQLIEQPKVSALYYTSAAKTDQHNRTRQDDLATGRKLVTQDWSKRVNLSVLSMIIVDTYLAHKHCTGSEESPNLFFHKLAEEMINYEHTTRRQKSMLKDMEEEVAQARLVGRSMRQTPTKRMHPVPTSSRKVSSGQKHQAKCVRCKNTCSTCREAGYHVYVCHTKSREDCWREHSREDHGIG
jgi:hypothetical protein